MDYEVLEVRCLGCQQLVTPAEVDWLLFRQSGMPVHNKKRCRDKLYARIYPQGGFVQPKPRVRKKVVPTA